MPTLPLVVNGRDFSLEVDPQTSLLTVLRDHLDLTGSKSGGGEGDGRIPRCEGGEPMNEKPQAAIVLDPERYELSAEPLYHFDVDRREFFKLLGAGVLVYSALNRAVTQESGGAGHSWGDSLP